MLVKRQRQLLFVVLDLIGTNTTDSEIVYFNVFYRLT